MAGVCAGAVAGGEVVTVGFGSVAFSGPFPHAATSAAAINTIT
jgi:acyl-CoA hydrolase